MELNLCMGCMKEKQGLGPCPHCGFQKGKYRPNPYYLPPETILAGKYLVGRVIGEGGFGITYVGYDLNRREKTAIKEFYVGELVTRNVAIRNGLEASSRQKGAVFRSEKRKFLEEAQRLAKFRGLAGIVEVKDCFQENETAYIIMEFVEGQTLQQVLDGHKGHIGPAQALELMKPVMESLEQVHRAGLIHRDISPDNIMVTPDHKGKLIDFGAARDFINRAKNMSVILKPHYAPIEQYKSHGVQGPWTDVYGLCATLYRAITGRLPDLATDRQEEDRLKPPSLQGIKMPKYQEEALMKGLSLDSRDRFQTMGELIEAFEEPSGPRLYSGAKAGCAGAPYEKEWHGMGGGPGKKPRPGTGHGALGNTAASKKMPGKIGLGALCGCLLLTLALAPFFIFRGGGQGEEGSPPVAEATGEEEALVEEGGATRDSKETARINILMGDYVKFRDENKMVLGSGLQRETISSIHFKDSLDHVPPDGWDVSAAGDGGVMAWAEPNGDKYDLYIAGDGGVCANPDSSAVFAYYSNLSDIDFGGCFDTSQVTDMSAMFSGCKSLTKLDLSSFDTSRVTDMGFMFQSCEGLTELNIGSFDTSQVTSMTHMFRVCASLPSLDVRHFDTSRVTDMSFMFEECASLARLDVSQFDTSQVTSMKGMFQGCTALEGLDTSGFDKSKVEDSE